MIIYKSVFSGCEVCSDSYPMEKYDEMGCFSLKGKNITDKLDQTKLNIGANPSAEDTSEEPAQDNENAGINIVLTHKLQVVAIDSKKDLKKYLQNAAHVLKKHYEESEDLTPKIPDMTACAQEFVKWILANFKDLVFYVDESYDMDCFPVVCKFEGVDPFFYFFKYTLEEEKF